MSLLSQSVDYFYYWKPNVPNAYFPSESREKQLSIRDETRKASCEIAVAIVGRLCKRHRENGEFERKR